MHIPFAENNSEQHLNILQRYEPEFIFHVEQARRENTAVTLVLEGYRNTKEIVWACLWYAMDQGVMVTVVPRRIPPPPFQASPEAPPQSAPEPSTSLENTTPEIAPNKNPYQRRYGFGVPGDESSAEPRPGFHP